VQKLPHGLTHVTLISSCMTATSANYDAAGIKMVRPAWFLALFLSLIEASRCVHSSRVPVYITAKSRASWCQASANQIRKAFFHHLASWLDIWTVPPFVKVQSQQCKGHLDDLLFTDPASSVWAKLNLYNPTPLVEAALISQAVRTKLSCRILVVYKGCSCVVLYGYWCVICSVIRY
jgi:hypothetical protein